MKLQEILERELMRKIEDLILDADEETLKHLENFIKLRRERLQ